MDNFIKNLFWPTDLEQVPLENFEVLLLRAFEDLLIYGAVLERKALVKDFEKVGRIVVHPKEHNPPHFHIEIRGGARLSVDLKNRRIEHGNLKSKQIRDLNAWLDNGGIDAVTLYWNRLNPSLSI